MEPILLPDESRWGEHARSDPRLTISTHCRISPSYQILSLLTSHRKQGIRESQDGTQQKRLNDPCSHCLSPPF